MSLGVLGFTHFTQTVLSGSNSCQQTSIDPHNALLPTRGTATGGVERRAAPPVPTSENKKIISHRSNRQTLSQPLYNLSQERTEVVANESSSVAQPRPAEEVRVVATTPDDYCSGAAAGGPPTGNASAEIELFQANKMAPVLSKDVANTPPAGAKPKEVADHQQTMPDPAATTAPAAEAGAQAMGGAANAAPPAEVEAQAMPDAPATPAADEVGAQAMVGAANAAAQAMLLETVPLSPRPRLDAGDAVPPAAEDVEGQAMADVANNPQIKETPDTPPADVKGEEGRPAGQASPRTPPVTATAAVTGVLGEVVETQPDHFANALDVPWSEVQGEEGRASPVKIVEAAERTEENVGLESLIAQLDKAIADADAADAGENSAANAERYTFSKTLSKILVADLPAPIMSEPAGPLGSFQNDSRRAPGFR